MKGTFQGIVQTDLEHVPICSHPKGMQCALLEEKDLRSALALAESMTNIAESATENIVQGMKQIVRQQSRTEAD